jgi:hypothetical protein
VAAILAWPRYIEELTDPQGLKVLIMRPYKHPWADFRSLACSEPAVDLSEPATSLQNRKSLYPTQSIGY